MNRAPIKLDQFLKLCGAVGTGGEAKLAIQSGAVRVNGAVETRRSRKLHPGDIIECGGEEYGIAEEAEDPEPRSEPTEST